MDGCFCSVPWEPFLLTHFNWVAKATRDLHRHVQARQQQVFETQGEGRIQARCSMLIPSCDQTLSFFKGCLWLILPVLQGTPLELQIEGWFSFVPWETMKLFRFSHWNWANKASYDHHRHVQAKQKEVFEAQGEGHIQVRVPSKQCKFHPLPFLFFHSLIHYGSNHNLELSWNVMVYRGSPLGFVHPRSRYRQNDEGIERLMNVFLCMLSFDSSH